MADSFIGEIRIFGFNYAPYDWAYCNGSTMSVQQYTPLFALLGITYGGDGKTTFMLPNLVTSGITGTSTATPQYALGKSQGANAVTLTEINLPSHNHSVSGEINDPTLMSGAPSATGVPGRCVNAAKTLSKIFTDATTPTVAMAPGTIATNGSGLPHENRQPILAMNFCISLAGTFPSFD